MKTPGRRHLLLVGLPLVFVVGAAAWALFYVPRAGWSTNDVTTGESPAYPDLQPRRYDVEVSHATMYAAEAARRLRGWRVRRTDPNAGIVEAEVSVPPAVGIFKDDVTVTIHPEGDAAVVKIRSHSRVGSGDLGENARHIRALQKAMDERLPPAP